MPRGTCRVRGLPVAPPDRGQIRLVPKTRRGFGPGRVAFSPQSKPSPNGEPDSGVWLVRTSAPPRGRGGRVGAQRAHARDSLPTSAPSLVGNGQFGRKRAVSTSEAPWVEYRHGLRATSFSPPPPG